jgi:hypothetical protein
LSGIEEGWVLTYGIEKEGLGFNPQVLKIVRFYPRELKERVFVLTLKC